MAIYALLLSLLMSWESKCQKWYCQMLLWCKINHVLVPLNRRIYLSVKDNSLISVALYLLKAGRGNS